MLQPQDQSWEASSGDWSHPLCPALVSFNYPQRQWEGDGNASVSSRARAEVTGVWSALWDNLPHFSLNWLHLRTSPDRITSGYIKIPNDIWFHPPFSSVPVHHRATARQKSVTRERSGRDRRTAPTSSPANPHFDPPRIDMWARSVASWCYLPQKVQTNCPEMRLTHVKIVLTWGVEMGMGLETKIKWEKKRRKCSVPDRGT